MRAVILSVFGLLFFAGNALAQLSAVNNSNATDLAQAMVGTGVTVTNATLICPPDGAGFFTASPASLGISQGVVLTTGYANDPSGWGSDISNPNDFPGMTVDAWMPGDPQLSTLANEETYDACILEFDVVPQGDTLKFDYIFGSEEYNEFVNSIYNDAFAFFISGPGIVGQQNIARIPGTSLPVTINNVNCGSYGQYYICNDPYDPFEGDCSGQCPTFAAPEAPEYDGLTVVLTAKAVVQPCQTYHLKLAVADVGDGALDSGVFLKEGSLTSAVVQASPDVNICPGQSTQLTVTGANANATYQWSPGAGLSCTNCQSPIANPNTTTTYTVTVTSGTGCSASDQVVVTTSGGVTATIATTVANCNVANGSANVSVTSGTAPYTYSWSNGSTTQNLSSVVSGSYTVTITDATGCNATLTANIGVTGAQTVSGSVVSSTCGLPNGSIDVTVSGGTSPYNYSWSNGGATQDVNGLVANTYTVTVTDAAGCNVTDTFNVATTSVPIISFTTVDPICTSANGSIDISVNNGTTPYTYAWSGGEVTEDLSNIAAGTFSVTVNDASGCTAVQNISLVADLAAPMVLSGLVDSLCVGSSFTATASGYDDFVWSPAAGLSSSTGGSVEVNTLTSQTYTVAGIDANGCVDTKIFDVTVLPFASVTYDETFTGCEPLTVQLVAHASNASHVLWWINNELVSTQTTATITRMAGTYDGMLVAVSPLGCNDTVTMPAFINVLQSPRADFEYARDVSSGSLFVFDFTNQTYYATSYQWAFGDGTYDSIIDPHHTFPGYGSYNVLLTATNDLGCTDTAHRLIEVNVPHNVFIPNTFTPNGDGMNETFDVFGLGIRKYKVQIYDRLGEKVFEGTNDDARWNGTFKGQPLNATTLVYIVDVEFLDDLKERYMGDINILR